MFLTSVFLSLSKVNLEIERKGERKRKEGRKEGKEKKEKGKKGRGKEQITFMEITFQETGMRIFPGGLREGIQGTGGSNLFLLEMGGSLYTSWSAVW